jgi:thiazole synthase
MNDAATNDRFELGGKSLASRLLLGTSRYPSPRVMLAAVRASGAEIVTVSVRRLSLAHPEQTFLGQLMAEPDLAQLTLLPNTAGCYTARDAIFTAELAREALGTNWIKVEVIGDEHTLLPDPIETLAACEALIRAGFTVLPYCSDDAVLCRRLAELGCAAVMPLAAPIGSGLGIRNPHALELIVEAIARSGAPVPVIVDAGIGTASDAARALELGCDAVLLNTAVAEAHDPIAMATAMRLAVEAGRMAYGAGRIPKLDVAQASSPLEGTVTRMGQ